MCAKRAPAEAGFTLLEVVVAVAIAALALVGLFQAGSGGLFAVDTAARAEEALQRAQSHLAALGRDAALVEGEFERRRRRRLPLAAAGPAGGAAAGRGGGRGHAANDDAVRRSRSRFPGSTRGHERAVVLQTLRLGAGGASG